MIPQLKYLEECEPGELVRLLVDEPVWGIKCPLRGHLSSVLIMSPTEIKTITRMVTGRIPSPDDVPVLAYGTDYVIEPDHTGPITFNDTKDIPGRIVQSEDELYLVAVAQGYRQMDYVF
jgi:hypothetical protein